MENNEIKIQKTTLMLTLGLIIMSIAAIYFVFGSGYGAKYAKANNDNNGGISGIFGQADSQAQNNQPQVGNAAQNSGSGTNQNGVQEVYLKATAYGYDKGQIVVKKGVPVRLHFTAQNAGCGSYLVIYGIGVTALSQNGQEKVVEFTPDREGTFEYNCGMRMFPPGEFIVQA